MATKGLNRDIHPTGYKTCRSDPTAILERLESVKQTGPGRWLARCPAHDDTSPSLAIRELPDGRILLHCFSGCHVADVVTSVGLEMADLFPRDPLPDGARPERRPFPADDALKALAFEATVVTLAASDVSREILLSRDDLERVQRAAERIRAALSYIEGGRHHG